MAVNGLIPKVGADMRKETNMSTTTVAARPVSYATAAQARAYVGSLVPGPGGAPVYLIASPAVRKGDRWARWTAELEKLLPGLKLITWRELPENFTGIPAAERPARLARALRGAIVLPDKRHGRRWIGHVAAAEARAFAAAGKPVLVYAEGRLSAWPDCRLVEDQADAPKFTPVEVLIPAEAPCMLPTLNASLRALGHAPAAGSPGPVPFRPLAKEATR